MIIGSFENYFRKKYIVGTLLLRIVQISEILRVERYFRTNLTLLNAARITPCVVVIDVRRRRRRRRRSNQISKRSDHVSGSDASSWTRRVACTLGQKLAFCCSGRRTGSTAATALHRKALLVTSRTRSGGPGRAATFAVRRRTGLIAWIRERVKSIQMRRMDCIGTIDEQPMRFSRIAMDLGRETRRTSATLSPYKPKCTPRSTRYRRRCFSAIFVVECASKKREKTYII